LKRVDERGKNPFSGKQKDYLSAIYLDRKKSSRHKSWEGRGSHQIDEIGLICSPTGNGQESKGNRVGRKNRFIEGMYI